MILAPYHPSVFIDWPWFPLLLPITLPWYSGPTLLGVKHPCVILRVKHPCIILGVKHPYVIVFRVYGVVAQIFGSFLLVNMASTRQYCRSICWGKITWLNCRFQKEAVCTVFHFHCNQKVEIYIVLLKLWTFHLKQCLVCTVIILNTGIDAWNVSLGIDK